MKRVREHAYTLSAILPEPDHLNSYQRGLNRLELFRLCKIFWILLGEWDTELKDKITQNFYPKHIFKSFHSNGVIFKWSLCSKSAYVIVALIKDAFTLSGQHKLTFSVTRVSEATLPGNSSKRVKILVALAGAFVKTNHLNTSVPEFTKPKVISFKRASFSSYYLFLLFRILIAKQLFGAKYL